MKTAAIAALKSSEKRRRRAKKEAANALAMMIWQHTHTHHTVVDVVLAVDVNIFLTANIH